MQIISALLSKDPAKRPSTRDIFDMEFIRQRAVSLRIDLPPRKVLSTAAVKPAMIRF